MKKFLSLFLAFVMVISVFAVVPVSANAITEYVSGDYTYKVLSNGTAEIIGYLGTETEVNIPSKLSDYDVSSIGSRAFYENADVISISVPDTVTSIGNWAFCGCENLVQISLSNTLESIGSYAFYRCIGLVEVIIPRSVKVINGFAFWDCTSLTKTPIGDSVEVIGDGAFYGCDNLTEVVIPDSVESIGRKAFYYCDDLAKVIVGNSIKSISDSTFCGCDNLVEIVIPNSVTSIGEYAFYGCSSLADISIPDGVTSISKACFYGCNKLTEVIIPNSVTKIGEQAFRCCENLNEVVIPVSVTHIGEEAFYSCFNLNKLAILNSECTIDSGDYYTVPRYTTIYGHNQSSAQKYAENYDREFKALCEGGYIEHKEEVLLGFDATCVKPGLTEGIHCKVCGEILSEQTEIDVVDHSFYWNHTDLMGEDAYDLRCSSCDEFFGRGYLGADGLYYLYAYFDFEEEGFCHYLYNDKAECLGTEKCKLAYWDSDDDYHTAICKCHLILLSEEPHVNINKYNSEGHWTECKTCGYLSEIEEHCYDSESDTNCNACEFTREIIEPITHSIYCVNSAGWENISVFAFNYIFEDGEIAGWESEYLYPGVSMEKIDTKAPNGSDIYIATFNQKYDYLVLVADGVELEQKFKSGWYYENNFGAWYESLDEIPTVLLGDIDGDGDINIMDATEIQRHIAQLSTIPEDRLSCADANKDGQVNIMDATQIQRFIAQLIPSL